MVSTIFQISIYFYNYYYRAYSKNIIVKCNVYFERKIYFRDVTSPNYYDVIMSRIVSRERMTMLAFFIIDIVQYFYLTKLMFRLMIIF